MAEKLANALARVSFTLDLPEHLVADWTKDVEDPSGDGFEEAMHVIERRVADDLPFLMDYMTAGEPDVEADA